MKHTTIIVLSLALLAVSAVAGEADDWKYDGTFHKLATKADRLVTRKGGSGCCGTVDDDEILFFTTNRNEIAKVNDLIRFETNQMWNACMCCGYPGLDWYAGNKRIALTSVQHGRAIRWNEFPGDALLTSASSKQLVEWLATHGITGPKEEIEASELRAAVAKEARAILNKVVPQDFLAALRRAEDEAIRDGSTGPFGGIPEDGVKDKYIRAAYANPQLMYSSLFQIIGCLSMHWNSQYSLEQYEAYAFLVRAPRNELDEALRAAASSKDPTERRGAARMIFCQHEMTAHGKTESDIRSWMELLAQEAYSDPFPGNRRVVLHQLVEHPSVNAEGVLRSGIEDPDQTTRRYALEALSVRKTIEAEALLTEVAKGFTRAREASLPPKDYSGGADGIYSTPVLFTPGMAEKSFDDTDQEAANQLLRRSK